MKTFLKILLGVLIVLVAIKVFPLTIALGVVAALVLGVAGVVGFSVLAVMVCIALIVVAVLAPIWIPVLVIAGVVALIKRTGAKSA